MSEIASAVIVPNANPLASRRPRFTSTRRQFSGRLQYSFAVINPARKQTLRTRCLLERCD
jgi:hypothetical protein